MEWTVLIGDEFEPEFPALPNDVQDEILAMARLLQRSGPNLGSRMWIRLRIRSTPI